VHFLQEGWESYKEPLDCRFEQQPNEYIAAFGVGYVMGFSRALAGLTLVEAAISLRLDASEVFGLLAAGLVHVRPGTGHGGTLRVDSRHVFQMLAACIKHASPIIGVSRTCKSQ